MKMKMNIKVLEVVEIHHFFLQYARVHFSMPEVGIPVDLIQILQR